MPQAPLPAPAARLVPQNLITPIIAGTSTPQDVIAHQWQVDMWQKAKEGADLTRQVALLPAERQQAVAKAAMDKMASEQAKEMQDQFNKEVKAIQLKYPGDPVKQGQEIMMARLRQGLFWSGGGQSNPQMLYQTAPGVVENPTHDTTPPPTNTPQNPNPVKPTPQQQPQQGILQRDRRAPNPDEVMLDTNNPAAQVVQVSNAPIYNPYNYNLTGSVQPAPITA